MSERRERRREGGKKVHACENGGIIQLSAQSGANELIVLYKKCSIVSGSSVIS